MEELKKCHENTSKYKSAIIKRELYFTDEKIYNNFCNMFMTDFDFLKDCGGMTTLDKRVSDDNYKKLNKKQREDVEWIVNNGIAVFFNNSLKLIIDTEGYSYSRYVSIVESDYAKDLLKDKEKEEENIEREDFYLPAPIAEQAQAINKEETYTLCYINPWTYCATTIYMTIHKSYITKYAQYEKSLYIEFTEKGKRKTQVLYLHDGEEVLLYKGFMPCVPEEMWKEKVSENMYRIRSSGESSVDYLIDVYKYYKLIGCEPIINTLQF